MNLKTERLLIRKLQKSDIPALVELWTDPDVTRFMGGPRDQDFLEQTFIEDVDAGQPDPYDLWPVIKTTSNDVIGHCGLLDKEVDGQPEVELTYVLHKSAWGRGYATEAGVALRNYAFETRQLGRLVALIDPANHGSERVALKVGMTLEKEVQRGDKMMRVYAITKNFNL
jgi:RimJ/RimL family protein N-acetyltransferase